MTPAFHIDRRAAVGALVAAGLLWGLTVPLTKLALAWLDGAWLALIRFTVAALLLAVAVYVRDARATARATVRALALGNRSLGARTRANVTPAVLLAGALGYGAVILFQNAGIARTSVTHAALIIGAVPALVALLAVSTGRGTTSRRAWIGYGVALAGIVLVAGASGGSATPQGDLLVLASATLSAAFVVIQAGLLAGRDPLRVTAAQMGAGAALALPFALAHGLPSAATDLAGPLALVTLTVAGTLFPMALFAFAQSAVEPAVAGAFLNLEPVVGAMVGAVAFHDAFRSGQAAGGTLVVAGLLLSAFPARRTRSTGYSRHGAQLDPPRLHRRRRSDRRGVGRAGAEPVPDRGVAAVVGRGLRRRPLARRRDPGGRRLRGRRLAPGAAPGQ